MARVAGAGASTPPPLDRAGWKERYQRPKSTPFPAANLYTLERAELGKALFFDPRLSRSGIVSCATCHNPSLGWSDAQPLAVGDRMNILGRRTPTILNLAWAETLFWDGRADSLEEQALGPIAAPGEMNRDLNEMAHMVDSIPAYRAWFARAYPGKAFTPAVVGKAIATFERTIVSPPAPFDRWVAGDDDMLSGEAKRGFDLFNGKAECAKCHSGWAFTDDGFHDIGIASPDLGRGGVLRSVPGVRHAFKTPTLRSIAARAPYFHNGSAPTLAAVIDFYDRGGDVARPNVAPDVHALGLSAAEKKDLLAFLEALTSAGPPVTLPELPR